MNVTIETRDGRFFEADLDKTISLGVFIGNLANFQSVKVFSNTYGWESIPLDQIIALAINEKVTVN
jgi:hypothetical protein